MTKKTDNHNLPAKVALRRHFLRRYHAEAPIRVLDCCQAIGRIWNELRREYSEAEYWGVDLKPKKGRLKLDSVRLLAMPGWPQNVIDVDTYGSPWKHWNALLPNAPEALTVFLTIGLVKVGGVSNYDRAILAPLGLDFRTLKLPPQIGVRLGELGVAAILGRARKFGFEIVECLEADNSGGNARYIGIRLEKKREVPQISIA